MRWNIDETPLSTIENVSTVPTIAELEALKGQGDGQLRKQASLLGPATHLSGGHA